VLVALRARRRVAQIRVEEAHLAKVLCFVCI
jgi:hypothetical protein